MKSIFAAIIAVTAAVVSAADTVVSSQPGLNQVITAGSTTPIVWKPISSTIGSIDLRKGDASVLTFVQNIATTVDGSLGTYAWAVDATLEAGTDYALSFSVDNVPSYSPYFTIKAATAAAGNATSAAPVVASSKAASAVVATTPAASKAAASSKAASAPAASSTSGANKNMAAVGVAAVAGAVVAALI